MVNSNKSAIIAKDKERAKELYDRLKRYKDNPDRYVGVDSNFWKNLSKNIKNAGFAPSCHIDILASRESSVKNNNSKFDDLSNVKVRLSKLKK